MRCSSVFLASCFLLAAIVTAKRSDIATPNEAYDGVNSGRRLRKVDTITAEERGALSFIKSWGKTQYWLAAGKSDDEVKKVLKLNGLPKEALKNHPNYKILQQIRYKREGRKMAKLVDDGVSTQTFWNRLGLARMSETRRENSDALRKYVRYATKYDDTIYLHKNSIFEPPIHYGGSPAEMKVKVQIWAKAKRKDWYVEEMLGLDRFAKADRKAEPEYKYFQEFLALRSAK